MADVELLARRAAALRHVATGCPGLPRNQAGAAIQYIMTGSVHYATEDLVNPTFVYLNGRINGQNDVPGLGTGVFGLALEYPIGTTPTVSNECLANGGNPVAAPVGFIVQQVQKLVPRGAKFRLRPYFYCADGVVWFQYQSGYICPVEQGCEIGSGTGANKMTSGTIGAAGNIGFLPLLVLSQSRNESVVGVGTSREEAGTDQITNPNNCVGITGRILGVSHGHLNLAIAASTLAQYIAATRTYRDQIINGTIPGVGDGVTPYFTTISNEHGCNDIGAGGDTPAQLAARHTAFCALYPKLKVIGQTIMPYNGSSDGWATKANQAGWGTSGNNFKVRQFNDLVRAGIPGQAGFWDIANDVDPGREGKWPTSYNPFGDALTPCTFTASLSGTTLTVTAIASGTLTLDAPFTDVLNNLGSVAPGTTIVEQLTGTAGSTGTYRVNKAHDAAPGKPGAVASKTMYVGAFGSNDGLHGATRSYERVERNRSVHLEVMRAA